MYNGYYLESVHRNLDQIYKEGFTDGRHYCRDKYKGLLIPNPDIDWDKELEYPCAGCEYEDPRLMLGCHYPPSKCEKYQRYLIALEIDKHFRKHV